MYFCQMVQLTVSWLKTLSGSKNIKALRKSWDVTSYCMMIFHGMGSIFFTWNIKKKNFPVHLPPPHSTRVVWTDKYKLPDCFLPLSLSSPENDKPMKGLRQEDLVNQDLITELRKEFSMTYEDFYMVLTDTDIRVKVRTCRLIRQKILLLAHGPLLQEVSLLAFQSGTIISYKKKLPL